MWVPATEELTAVNSSSAARASAAREAHSLENDTRLSVGSKVLLTANICATVGLVNGSTGIVQDIIYLNGDKAPNLRSMVIVDFGAEYSGPPFFPQPNRRSRGWLPIMPKTVEWASSSSTATSGRSTHSRKQIPLRLAWAWTAHKVQGQTITGKVMIDLGSKENTAGIS